MCQGPKTKVHILSVRGSPGLKWDTAYGVLRAMTYYRTSLGLNPVGFFFPRVLLSVSLPTKAQKGTASSWQQGVAILLGYPLLINVKGVAHNLWSAWPFSSSALSHSVYCLNVWNLSSHSLPKHHPHYSLLFIISPEPQPYLELKVKLSENGGGSSMWSEKEGPENWTQNDNHVWMKSRRQGKETEHMGGVHEGIFTQKKMF